MIETQLLLGLVAAFAWGGAALRIWHGSIMGDRGVMAGGVCIAAAVTILVFGSLFLLGIADGAVWFVTGTGLRVVVAVTGLIALVDQYPDSFDEYAKIADDLKAERHDQYANLAGAIAENTRLTQRASDNADAAHAAATSVREQITGQGETIIAQGEAAAEDRVIGEDTNATAHRIDDRTP